MRVSISFAHGFNLTTVVFITAVYRPNELTNVYDVRFYYMLSHNEIVVTLIQFSVNTRESRNVVVINLSGNMLIEESLHAPEKLIPKLQLFTLNEVANHGDASDCWIIIYDRVYRITDFLDKVSLSIPL